MGLSMALVYDLSIGQISLDLTQVHEPFGYVHAKAYISFVRQSILDILVKAVSVLP